MSTNLSGNHEIPCAVWLLANIVRLNTICIVLYFWSYAVNANWATLTASLNAQTLAPYRQAADGALDQAAELYLFDRNLSGALWITLSQVKTVIINAIDLQLQCHTVVKSPSMHWLFDESKILGRDAHSTTPHHQKPYSHVAKMIVECKFDANTAIESILALLPDHFWLSVMSTDTESLWPALMSGFNIHKLDEFEDVCARFSQLVEGLQHIKSGLPVFNLTIDDIFYNAIRLASYVDEGFATWLYETSSISEILKNHPLKRT